MLRSAPMFSVRSAGQRVTPLLIALVMFAGIIPPAVAQEPVNIVVTIPVLKDLTEQVGKGHVRVTSLLSGYENEHTYSPKPSDLVAVRKARLLFEVGVGLEVWVSSLVKNAGTPSLRVVTTSQGIGLVRDQLDDHHQTGEDRKAAGNPHIWLDPENAAIMLRHITEALIAADPAHAADFRNNQAAYLQQLDRLVRDLSIRVRQVSDRRFIAHHPAWPYLARRFGFEIAGVIQLQSGTEPSALHLQSLIARIKKERIKVIVSEVQLSQKIPDLLAKETKARVVVLTTLPGGVPGTGTYLDMLRYNVLQLCNALETT
ncbi:metal ABC transporter substrate-binding protein [Nitrospira moscoviensis]|uniref:Putative Manganese transport system, periplasmic binding component n=1 Tax=Nitrospira moscoviensis TaxID=42253 RepID=A0A0K2G717_NITMO|nr:metal ABC transporter substrate-binding protein [Nitrospira moscoviensis]ALA56748.1 putative Manganese transport system, periplasmic binding component [Nitrospira moscoviensis]